MKFYNLILALIAVLSISCSSTDSNGKKDTSLLPPANGMIGEIVTVMDSTQWSGELGDALRKNVQIPMEALPQDELLYDLKKVSPLRINNVLRKATNLLYVITLDGSSDENRALRQLVTKETRQQINADTTRFIKVSRDQYAKGQILVFLFARDSKLLARKIRENAEYIRSVFGDEERSRMLSRLSKGRQSKVEQQLQADHGYQVLVPYGYDIAKSLQNFVWIRQLDAQAEKNIFIYEEDYDTQYQLDRISDLREEITGTYLRDSEKAQLYITQQSALPMITDTITVRNKFALRNKGLWKVSDSSAGGPYISYVLVDETKRKLYYIEGYVYSPGYDKKNLIREVDAILSSFRTPTEASGQ